MYLEGMCNYLLLNFGFFAEVFIYNEGFSWFLNHAKDLFFLGIVLFGCIYALYKLLNYQEEEREYKLMRCPECGKEPYKLWKVAGRGVSLSQRMRGYLNCIHCGTHLRRMHSKAVYAYLLISTLTYLSLYAILYLVSFKDNLELLVWTLSILGIIEVISILMIIFYLVTKSRFVKVDDEGV